MARFNQEWDDFAQSIQEVVDRAINSQDYRKLNQTITQVVERAIDVGSEAVRKAVDTTARAGARTVYTVNPPVKTTVTAQKRDLPVLYGDTRGKTAVGIAKTAGGGIISFVTFVAFLSSLIVDILVSGQGLMAIPTGLSLAGLAGGMWLAASGIKTLNRMGRFKTYRKTLGEKTHCTLEKLARSVGKSVKFVRRELLRMIEEGLFLQGHMDAEETCLITSHDTYRQFEQSRLQLEQRRRLEAAAQERQKLEAAAKERQAAEESKKTPAHSPQVQEVLDRGDAYVAEIRACNDAIPGEEISAKISRMEMIVDRIFDRAEKHPEIVPDLKKMMDYYLPMTVKLLRAYADMDAQPIQGETIISSKKEIEATLDTLNTAFEKLLDSVFRETAMDVSSDISVLNTLLAQEGLTEDELEKMQRERKL